MIFLAKLQRQELSPQMAGFPEDVFEKPTLNEFAALADPT